MTAGALGLVVVSLAAGTLLAAQGPVLTRLAAHVGGPLQAGAVAFAIGLLALLVLCLASGSGLPRLGGLGRMPLWVWMAGLIGAVVILVTLFAVPRIGVASFVAAMICGQLIGALVIDHFGGFGLQVRPVGLRELAGAALLLAGMALVVGDRGV